MKPSEALRSHSAAIRGVVEANRARNARVFGFVLHGLNTEQSDLDILIDPTPQTTLMDIAAIQVELERLLGVTVDALETALSFYVEARKPLPVASKAKRGQRTVRPSALEGAKLGVYQAMTEQGIKKAELARRLGWHMPQVDRLFDLRHASRLDQIEAAARALGRHVEVRVA